MDGDDISCSWGNCSNPNQNACINDCLGTYYTNQDFDEDTPQQLCSSILPINMIAFTGEYKAPYNEIKWTTGSEINNNYFILYHSTDGRVWNDIVRLPGAGNSIEEKNYNAKHYQPEKEINYYKVAQVDYDGGMATYGPISIDNRDAKRNLIQRVNLLGQEVNEYYSGIVIYVYDDGTKEKVYQ